MKDFELHLKKAGLAENTVRSYLYGVRFFLENYELKMEDLFEYKGYLLDNFKPKTVNLRLQGVNKYLAFIGHDDLKLKFVKVQQKPFLEDVISHADYLFLKRSLKKDGILKWHFVVWFLGATGARVSELIFTNLVLLSPDFLIFSLTLFIYFSPFSVSPIFIQFIPSTSEVR